MTTSTKPKALIEYRTGVLMSYIATGLSILLCGYLYYEGIKNPRLYLSSMAINHHAEYGMSVKIDCYECHRTPTGLVAKFGGPITCMTAQCHGELLPNYSKEESYAYFAKYKPQENYLPYFPAKTDHHLALHAAVRGQDCIECHTEHTNRPVPMPEGFESFKTILAREQAAGNWRQ
ncbi:MAG: hypothetical protein SFY68_04295 [Candidatus Sumerlaeia bacterium]|nr:hypothetical protein [Candidatus Sumerlaeia bacterium]